jgi:hypothetical protein
MTDDERQLLIEMAQALMDHAADCECCQRLMDRAADLGIEI